MMPETPVFLYKQDKILEGDRVLKLLYNESVLSQKKQELQLEVSSVKLESQLSFFSRLK